MSYKASATDESGPVRGGGAGSSAANASCVGRLAQFFPAATPVRLTVRVTHDAGSSEETVIEYGTSREVLFASQLPMDFGEHLHLRNADGSLDAEARVVAMQLHSGETAIAARFTGVVANWIVKP